MVIRKLLGFVFTTQLKASLTESTNAIKIKSKNMNNIINIVQDFC